MTLIMSYRYDSHLLMMLGDLLVSSADPRDDVPDLPSRYSSQQDPVHAYIRRLEQKIIILLPRLAVAWAGNWLIARLLLERIRDAIGDDYSGSHILKLIETSGRTSDELESVSFIFYSFTKDGQLTLQDYLAKQTAQSPTHYFTFSGSGDWHFFENIGFERKDTGSPSMNETEFGLTAVFSRAAIAFHEEVVSETPHNFFYGGGFEALVPDPPSQTMIKIPHGVAYWMVKDGGIGLIGPIISYQYHTNGVLQIDRFVFSDGTWSHRPYLVGNMFTPVLGVETLPPAISFGPMVHYLIDASGKREQLSFVVELGQRTFSVHQASGSIDIALNESSHGFTDIRRALEKWW